MAAEAQARLEQAARSAPDNPGTAPRSSALAPGNGPIGDLTDEERQLIAGLALTVAAGAGHFAHPARPAGRGTRPQYGITEAAPQASRSSPVTLGKDST